MSGRHCQFTHGKGENILEKYYLLKRNLKNFFVALVVSYWPTGKNSCLLMVSSPEDFLLSEDENTIRGSQRCFQRFSNCDKQ
jgi:hypothetical protein